MPYSTGNVSMMVHRVGNTLLLDDFDIHQHLLRQQEQDWKWLKEFFMETILRNSDNPLQVNCISPIVFLLLAFVVLLLATALQQW